MRGSAITVKGDRKLGSLTRLSRVFLPGCEGTLMAVMWPMAGLRFADQLVRCQRCWRLLLTVDQWRDSVWRSVTSLRLFVETGSCDPSQVTLSISCSANEGKQSARAKFEVTAPSRARSARSRAAESDVNAKLKCVKRGRSSRNRIKVWKALALEQQPMD